MDLDALLPPPLKEGETVRVGYMSYIVHKSWWSTRLSSNEFLNKRPNARFLFVLLSAKNEDFKNRTIPPFRLLDENYAQHDAFSGAALLSGAISFLDELNPQVEQKGVVVFDVRPERQYRLVVSGGYWSEDEAEIELNPAPLRK